jgi:hypothetical protein
VLPFALKFSLFRSSLASESNGNGTILVLTKMV